MIKTPATEAEAKMPTALHTKLICDVIGCGCDTFTVHSGGSSCCAWVAFTCTKCGYIDDWDIGTGDC